MPSMSPEPRTEMPEPLSESCRWLLLTVIAVLLPPIASSVEANWPTSRPLSVTLLLSSM